MNIQEPDAAKNMTVAAQVNLAGKGAHAATSVDEELQMPMMGSNLKSVADGSACLIAIQNVSSEPATANVTCIEQGTTKKAALQLQGGALLLMSGCAPLPDGPARAPSWADLTGNSNLGVASAYQINGGTGSLAAFGLSVSATQQEPRVDAAIFVNQSSFTSQTTVFAGIPVGPYDPLPNSTFAPEPTVANFSAANRTINIRGTFGDGSAPKTLASFSLAPLTVKPITAPSQTGSGLATVLVDQDGAPGDVAASLTDLDNSGQTTLVPLPKLLHHSNNGGGHPWSIERGTSSALVLFNASPKARS